MPTDPIAKFTLSHRDNLVSPAHVSGIRYSHKFLLDWEMPVTDEETVESLEYRQLQKYTKYQKIWNTSY